MSAGPSRSRVTRIELTADQLLGADLTPARPHKPSKHVPKVITVEQLLGSSLTIAPTARGGSGSSTAASPSRSASRATARPPLNSVRSVPTRSPSPLRIPVIPTRERVTADEVLRTGVPLRTLQAAKQRARSAQALVLTAEQLLSSSSGSARSNVSSSSGLAQVASGSSRRSNPAGDRTSPSTGGSRPGRVARPSTAGATTGGDARGRDSRHRQARRSSSLGSTHTLPIYTKEPGESEVVIDRCVLLMYSFVGLQQCAQPESAVCTYVCGYRVTATVRSVGISSYFIFSHRLDMRATPDCVFSPSSAEVHMFVFRLVGAKIRKSSRHNLSRSHHIVFAVTDMFYHFPAGLKILRTKFRSP